MRKKINFEEIDNLLDNIKLFDEKNLKKNIQTKNQLFREFMDYETLKMLMKEVFSIELNENINYSFSKKTISSKNIIPILEDKIDFFKSFYIKCKHKIYLENLNEKKVITLFRQLLRVHDYDLRAKEKYENGKKYLLYNITKKMEVICLKKINSTINFD
jgi:hypothetical protein